MLPREEYVKYILKEESIHFVITILKSLYEYLYVSQSYHHWKFFVFFNVPLLVGSVQYIVVLVVVLPQVHNILLTLLGRKSLLLAATFNAQSTLSATILLYGNIVSTQRSRVDHVSCSTPLWSSQFLTPLEEVKSQWPHSPEHHWVFSFYFRSPTLGHIQQQRHIQRTFSDPTKESDTRILLYSESALT